MFAHKVSPVCRFNAKCATKLCQFRHTKNTTKSSEEEDNKSTSKENGEGEPTDSDHSYEHDTESGVESCDF